jgi:uncharacterized protein
MTGLADSIDLGGLHLSAGEGRRLEPDVVIEPFELGAEHYAVGPSPMPVRLDLSRTTGGGYALRLRFEATLSGPCMRCLEPAAPVIEVDAREVSQPGEGEELESPYVVAGVLDLFGWARDALALSLPVVLECRPQCAGLCPVCGINLNTAEASHGHESGPDPRWAPLSEIQFE